ncbi:hypothetical protein RRG08_005855 [Elysia crispata]|uniref:Fucolectin tachylectin-4 pentraxin-1 domain-containing protein n=1 Tax=Elysia crispata TaxID=231223 RepID=A0AAE0Z710_9GAST|nr:hypothetical protein RRG08_005855 [Elysia crispata]
MYLIYHVTLTALTVIAFSLTIYGDQTPCTTNGWFGPNCQYQCHCAGSAPCDKHDGSCSSGCHQDWFGPACQYARMVFTVNGNINPRWLTDNKDTTCNRGNLRSVTVTLDTPIPLTWLRVVVSGAVYLNKMSISYRNESSSHTECPESHTTKITGTIADISCPTDSPVTSLTLSGDGVYYLCSLHISAAQIRCTKGWFGPDCQYQCHCAGSAPCDKHDGSCSSGCHQDWFGPACQYQCHCAGSAPCDKHDGSCSSGCHQDWFGPACQYQCHCAGSAPCDKHDGSCSSGCHQDWFGPACQYARMGFTVTGTFSSSWLTDNKDATCNTGNTQSITVTLDTAIPLTWLRVVVSDAAHLSTVKILYRIENSSTKQQCLKSNTAKINETTADISCPTEYPVTRVTLSGQGVEFLCSLYISAGRNVALKQRAGDASTWFNDGSYYLWWAEYAVDGKIPTTNEKRSSQNTCTHTALHDRSPWWQVSFTHPVEITRFVIENRGDCCQERLKNFLLTVYPVNDSYIPIKHRGSNTVKNTYSVVPTPRISFPVTQVKVTQGFNRERFLTLCEVLAFGEIACPSNRYGLRPAVLSTVEAARLAVPLATLDWTVVKNVKLEGTDLDANIPVVSPVEVTTILVTILMEPVSVVADLVATETLSVKTYGVECFQNCSITCGGPDSLCHHVDGRCSSECDAGFKGEHCDQMCPNGTYGVGCSQNCSVTCGGPDSLCHHIDGRCSSGCDAGFKGEHCNPCDNGTYGVECSQELRAVTCGVLARQPV